MNHKNNNNWEKMWANISRHVSNHTYSKELSELESMQALLPGVKVFVDAGANFGPYTWLAHYVLENSEIIAIEANPRISEHLKAEAENIRLSADSRGNTIKIVSHPLSDSVHDILFNIDQNDYSVSTIAGTKVSSNDNLSSLQLRTTTLDHLFPNNTPDLVKLDIEGTEWRALDGARGIIAKAQTMFFVEIHPWGDASVSKKPSDVFKLFRESGYSVKRLNHHWLFSPEQPGVVNLIASHIYGIACDNTLLRSLARSIFRA